MKRLIASATLLLALACYLIACEKDDICPEDTPTTPSLIIEFYDKDNRTELKNVINFKYFAEGSTDTIPVTEPGVNTSFNRIEVPLRVDADVTKWGFIYSEQVTGGFITNTDFMEFRYDRNETYVSRACGYRTTFTLLPNTPESPNPVLSDAPEPDNLWIEDFDVETTNIQNEDEVHIKIYL